MQAPDNSRTPVEISIIVPVYDVAEYVEDCLQSIRQQTFDKRFEALIVDDCSGDGSGEICQRFCEQTPNFTFLQNPENQGVSMARNRGLDKACGRYFMFTDPDDLLPHDALALLHAAAENNSCDIVKGNNTIFDSTTEKPARYNVSRSKLIRGERVLTTLYEHKEVRGHTWGKLFRRERLGEFRFPPGVRMAQDLVYCGEVFASAGSLLLLDQNVYRYRNRETGSTGRKFKSGSYMDWLDSVENTGRFAATPGQRRAYKSLLLRTMTQLARECRKLGPEEAGKAMTALEHRRRQWQIDLSSVLRTHKLDLRSLLRYLKLVRAIRQTRQSLRNTQSGNQSR